MSYILDALRKADAQRSRGTVPDLRAQPLGEPTAGDAPTARRWLPWGGALLVLAAVGVMAWRLMAPAAPPDDVADAAPAAAPVARALPSRPVPGGDPAPPAPIAEVRLLPTPREPAAEPARAASAASLPQVPPAAAVPAPAVATAGAPPPAAASTSAQRVPKLAELAPDLRAQVPTLTVGGAMYSQDAANRMLIVNGQLFREGDQPAPGVVLERIQLKSAVLSVRGTRFEIAY